MRYRTRMSRSIYFAAFYNFFLGAELLFLHHGKPLIAASHSMEWFHRTVPYFPIGVGLLLLSMRFFPFLKTDSESLNYGGLLVRHSIPYAEMEQISTVICTRTNRRAYPAANVGKTIVEIGHYGFKKSAFCLTHTAEFLADLAQRAPQARIVVQPPLK